MMTDGRAQKISNTILSFAAGFASFVFSLLAFLYITTFNQQVVASIVAGTFCLMIAYIASERPNSEGARAMSALADRLLAVEDGDLTSPPPAIVREKMPKVANAVDTLFAEVRASIENAQALGMYDPVTSLPNRLHFRAEAERLLAVRNGKGMAAMLFVDLDRFKRVNDSLGHARGDQLLVMVANRLRVVVSGEQEGVSGRPLLARLAGDEFTIFIPAASSQSDIERLARRVTFAVSEPFELHGHSIDIGASVGVAVCPDHGESIETLMRAADIAMYRAKSRGGGRHCVFSKELAAEYESKVQTENALGEAIQRGQFLLAFQPQMSLVTGEIIGAEALLRWNHPRDGMRMPATFIPVAEGTGQITEIGDWVMAEVASTLANWAKAGIRPRVAFNISPRQLDRSDFFQRLREQFVEAHVPLSQAELEFTETAAMNCTQQVLEEIRKLRDEGATITIDDFGTGYSNIARLRSMPLDRVKLDQALIADIETNEIARTVVQAVIHLIKGVGAEVVAEAVETAAQTEMLRAMGCDTVQGFVFGEPMFDEEFAAWVTHAAGPNRSVA